MNDGETTAIKLGELLRHPDDLDKIGALKSEFARKKAAVDDQLKVGLKEQLQTTQAGMTSLADGQRTLNLIKEEMIKIDRLCAEAQTMIKNFPEINAVAQAHRNFAAVDAMKSNIETFNEQLDDIKQLLREDEDDIANQPNLLKIHYGLTQLRNVRDEAMDQVKRADDASLEGTLMDHFRRLDDTIDDFDEHVGNACTSLIPLVQNGNTSLVVRLAVIIEEEEKFDNRVKELQEAQREYKDLASRFKSLATGHRELRGYKDKFLESIKVYAKMQIEGSDEAFKEDPDKLEKSVRWYFNDLFAVREGMQNLMPKKWKIFKTYVGIYHQLMYEWLQSKAEDKNVTPTHMIAIIHFKDKYYNKMERLGVSSREVSPELPGGRDSELVREYRQIIVDKVDQWMAQLNKTDKKDFRERNENALDHDEHGHFRTKTLGDMWRMLREQLVVAANAEVKEVPEGVTDAMFRALKARQDMLFALVKDELTRYSKPQTDQESMNGVQDWLIALASDQLATIHDDVDSDPPQLGYLSSFQADYESLVSPEHAQAVQERFIALKDGFLTLGFNCITVFARLIILVDFRVAMTEFFTPTWYSKSGMGPILTTYEDYLGDYSDIMSTLLRDVLIEEMSKQLLFAYLGGVRNKGAKVLDPVAFSGGVRGDVQSVFKFFSKYDSVFPNVKETWRVVEDFVGLITCEKHIISVTFETFLRKYPDTRLSWVEAVLRIRDDVDFSPLGDGKSTMKNIRAIAADKRADIDQPTIMSELD